MRRKKTSRKDPQTRFVCKANVKLLSNLDFPRSEGGNPVTRYQLKQKGG